LTAETNPPGPQAHGGIAHTPVKELADRSDHKLRGMRCAESSLCYWSSAAKPWSLGRDLTAKFTSSLCKLGGFRTQKEWREQSCIPSHWRRKETIKWFFFVLQNYNRNDRAAEP